MKIPKLDRSIEQYEYTALLFHRTCTAIQDISSSDFLTELKPTKLCDISSALVGSKDWCLQSQWLESKIAPQIVTNSDGFPIDSNTLSQIIEQCNNIILQDSKPTSPTVIGSEAYITVGHGQKILSTYFEQEICEHPFRYIVSVTNRDKFLMDIKGVQYLSYDEMAIQTVLATGLTFLKSQLDLTRMQLLSAIDNQSYKIAIKTGILLFDSKKHWNIPITGETLVKFLEAFLVVITETLNFSENIKIDLGKIYDYRKLVTKKDAKKIKLNLDALYTRIMTAYLISIGEPSFRRRIERARQYAIHGKIK